MSARVAVKAKEVLEEMRAREIFATDSLLRTEATHAVTLMAAAGSLFVVLAAAGLLIDQLASLAATEGPAAPTLLGRPNKGRRKTTFSGLSSEFPMRFTEWSTKGRGISCRK